MTTKKAEQQTVMIPVAMPTSAVSSALPMFPDLGKNPAVTANRVRVRRISPLPQVYLGELPSTSDEESIRVAFGGGVYEVMAINAGGQVIAGGRRTVSIAGDPNDMAKPASTPTAAPVDLQAILQWHEQRAEMERTRADDEIKRIRTEQQAERDKKRAETEDYIARVKADSAARVAELKAEMELSAERERQRHTQDLERERERAKTDRESQERAWKAVHDSSQQSHKSMMEMIGQYNQPGAHIEMFAKGMELAAGMNKEDPSSAIAKSISDGVGNLAQLAMSDGPRGAPPGAPPRPGAPPGQRPNPQLPAGAAAPRAAAAQAPAAPAPGGMPAMPDASVMLKLQKLMELLQAQGANPDEVLEDILNGDLVLADPDDVKPAEETPDDDQAGMDGDGHPDGGGAAAGPVAGGDAGHRGPATPRRDRTALQGGAAPGA